MQECSFARGKADARTVAHKADVRDVRGVNAARRNRHGAGERRAALAADQVAAEIFHRQSTLVCHRGQLQNVDRLSIRLVREGVEQRVQVVDRRHRVVIFGQRHDRDARDLDCVVQAQRVAVFEVDRPDDVALALFELLGVEARIITVAEIIHIVSELGKENKIVGNKSEEYLAAVLADTLCFADTFCLSASFFK